MPKSLVIVESPTKARTIAQFLSKDFVVESSVGHIRDLPESATEIPKAVKAEPWSRLGIDIEHDFKPLYVVPSDKKEQVSRLKSLMADADRLFLATDEDREGESISWHLREVLKPKVPVFRMVFHEITREAIQEALRSPRDIDDRLVTAQETRRVLDRLYGYEVSPVLWRKIAPKLSAGRVQSVAVRMIVNREKARIAFRESRYWDLAGAFSGPAGGEFQAELVSLGGKRLIAGKDFDPDTGKPHPEKKDLVFLDAAAAEALRARLGNAAFQVLGVERKPYQSSPPAPFTTSTLQQEANRKLSLASRETMRLAQALYERGYITYMRTDSTTLSDQAVQAARAHISSSYGPEFLPAAPREYRSTVKNAQEAHEAIRPAGERFRLPEELKGELEGRELLVYEMIWKRTVASQMPNARGERVALQVQGDDAVFQASGLTFEFYGFLRAYVEGSDDPEAELGDQERILPALQPGQPVTCNALKALEHATKPPARYTEASLIKELEKEGIGRPSTYSSIIETIVMRQYVTRRRSMLVPSFMAFAVVQLLEQNFTHLVDLGFTARMEDVLDAISRGESERLPYLKEFYFGTAALPGLHKLVQAEIDPRQACTIPLGADSQDRPIAIRIGRYGPYLERGTDRASLPADMLPDELTTAVAEHLLATGNAPRVLGTEPESGKTVFVRSGRFGPFVQLGEMPEDAKADRPKMKSLLPGQAPETIGLEDALQLLSLPRKVGADASTGEDVLADLGRFGPYLRRGKDTRSLPSPESVFSVTLEEAAELFLKEKNYRRGQAAPLRVLGAHPTSQAPLVLMNGRYGPYVTDGENNASLPRGSDPAQLTLEEAVRLLAERAAYVLAQGPRAKGQRGKGQRGKGGGFGAKRAAAPTHTPAPRSAKALARRVKSQPAAEAAAVPAAAPAKPREPRSKPGTKPTLRKRGQRAVS